MTRTRPRFALVGIVLLLTASTLPASVGITTAAEHSFVVEQGEECWEVSPLRGSDDVASFYDYRNPENTDGTGQYTYSSYMPDHLTREDTSRLFLYEGPDGVSLVMVHNERGGDEDDGSAATFRFDGLPSGGDWAVEDDDYSGQDDRFYGDRIDWSWRGTRNDGAAFRGVDREGTEITIDPAFDEEAALYDSPVDRSGTTEAWQFLTGSLDDPSAVTLDPDRPVTIRTGHCGPDETAPNARLSAGDGVVGSAVSFDASESTDEGGSGVATYRWDFDGDGEVDRETTDPTVERTYDSAGTYNATVTVVDGAGNADTATAEVRVEADDPPSATFSVGDSPTEGFPVVFDAGNATDDMGIAEYRWDFDGDGETDRRTEDPTVEHVFENASQYEVALTVVDSGGQNATATRTVSVGADEPPTPVVEVVSPEAPVEGEEVVLSAANSTDDTGVTEYRWSLGPNATATGERVAHTFGENGTFEVTLTVVDEGGNDATTTAEIDVLPTDETAPTAAIRANRTSVAAGESVGFDATESSDGRSIASYRWTFGDGAEASGPDATHAYDEPGNYTATVVVTDAGGNRDAANVTIEVRAPDETPPTAELSAGTNRTKTGESVRFDASNSTDDGGSDVAAYRWDFDGDGETDRRTEDPTVEHAYDSTGNYTATVVVVDGANNTDEAAVAIRVDQNRKAHPGDGDGGSTGGGDDGGAGGGGGGSVSLGPPPVQTAVEKRGPNAGLVDVRNGRGDETIRADLPASAVGERSGVRFRSVAVDLAGDDSHFVVETRRTPAESAAAELPADASLGVLSVDAKYVESRKVRNVTYEVAIERSRLADAGLAPADLRAYQRAGGAGGESGDAGGAWERANLTVTQRGKTVVLRVRADAFAPVAIGAERTVTVADVRLAAAEVPADEPASVNATLRNEGDQSATFTANLTADGEVVATKTVTVPAGATKRVTVGATLAPGTHRLTLDGESVGNVTVAEPVADVVVANVSLNASTVAPGERVAVTATVENRGSKSGERTVALTLFDQRVATRTVSVSAGETARVTFVRSVDAAGNYTATVGNESATLRVTGRETTNDESAGPSVPIPGFGVGAAVAALVAALLVARRRL